MSTNHQNCVKHAILSARIKWTISKSYVFLLWPNLMLVSSNAIKVLKKSVWALQKQAMSAGWVRFGSEFHFLFCCFLCLINTNCLWNELRKTILLVSLQMLGRSKALFIKEYNNRLFNWLVTFALVMVVVGRFVVKFLLLEVGAWIMFIFLETYTRMFWSAESLYYNPAWHLIVSVWETIVYSPILDLDRYGALNSFYWTLLLYISLATLSSLNFSFSQFGSCCWFKVELRRNYDSFVKQPVSWHILSHLLKICFLRYNQVGNRYNKVQTFYFILILPNWNKFSWSKRTINSFCPVFS
jgi:hypothetical protein